MSIGTINWETENRHNHQQPDLHSKRELHGIYIAYVASKLQQDITPTLLWYTNQPPDHFTSMLLALYNCIAIDISHPFTSHVWLTLSCEFPTMPVHHSPEPRRSVTSTSPSGSHLPRSHALCSWGANGSKVRPQPYRGLHWKDQTKGVHSDWSISNAD